MDRQETYDACEEPLVDEYKVCLDRPGEEVDGSKKGRNFCSLGEKFIDDLDYLHNDHQHFSNGGRSQEGGKVILDYCDTPVERVLTAPPVTSCASSDDSGYCVDKQPKAAKSQGSGSTKATSFDLVGTDVGSDERSEYDRFKKCLQSKEYHGAESYLGKLTPKRSRSCPVFRGGVKLARAISNDLSKNDHREVTMGMHVAASLHLKEQEQRRVGDARGLDKERERFDATPLAKDCRLLSNLCASRLVRDKLKTHHVRIGHICHGHLLDDDNDKIGDIMLCCPKGLVRNISWKELENIGIDGEVKMGAHGEKCVQHNVRKTVFPHSWTKEEIEQYVCKVYKKGYIGKSRSFDGKLELYHDIERNLFIQLLVEGHGCEIKTGYPIRCITQEELMQKKIHNY